MRTLGALAAIAGAVLFSTAPAYAVTVSGVEVGPLDPGPGDTAWEAGQPVLPDAVAQGAAAAPPPGVADAGAHPSAPARCTVTARSDALPPVKPGDVVCLSGNPAAPLVIKTGGTAALPIIYAGRGAATVRGIDVEASNVVVEGFTSDHGNSMGAKLVGDHIVFQDNTITHPVYTGDDSDGVRFFGDEITLQHNTVVDVQDGSHCTNDGCGDGPHPDCFQTFVSDHYPSSSNIRIAGNRCVDIAAQCLMAEGPVLPGEHVDLPGQSSTWLFDGNYCDDGANQALMIKDIKNLSVTNNDFEGTNHKAIALADASTGAHVTGNHLNPRIGTLLTFDDDASAGGYSGTPVRSSALPLLP